MLDKFKVGGGREKIEKSVIQIKRKHLIRNVKGKSPENMRGNVRIQIENINLRLSSKSKNYFENSNGAISIIKVGPKIEFNAQKMKL